MSRTFPIQVLPFLRLATVQRGAIFGAILLAALLAFEIFNFSTTQFALLDVLGDLRFAGFRWATILAIAFCGIDFAGIARLFTPEQGRDEPAEVWYLFGAWLLAAGFNAMLTWWGVSVAILNHQAVGSAVIGQTTLTKVVPLFVAVMVWLIRLLIIGTFSIAGERLFSMAEERPLVRQTSRPASTARPAPEYVRPAPRPIAPAAARASRPSTGSGQRPSTGSGQRPEPTYHPIGVSARGRDENQFVRR